MKILLATSAIIPAGGGIASYNQELINAIKLNNVIDVITEENITNAQYISRVISICDKNIYSYGFCKTMIDEINNAGYDVIINSNSRLVSLISPYISSPIVSVSHFVNGKLALVAGYNARYVQKIIALSHYGKKFIEDKYQIKDKGKVSVLYNFIHSKNFQFDEGKLNPQTLNIVYPGGTSIQKSFDIVMSSLRLLIRHKDLKFNFFWLGGKKLPAAKLCIPKDVSFLIRSDTRVHFIGRIKRDEAIRIMGSANVFLLPSRGEGCPMTLLEAMQYGCIPIVSDAHHGSREILEDGQFGIVVRNDNAKDLYNQLFQVINNHQDYVYNYKQTYSYSKTKLSKELWTEQMMNYIVEIMNERENMIVCDRNHFQQNVLKMKCLIFEERIKEILRSLRSSIICNWFYLTK
ncbi:glycosyltransferase family 4 protein [Parabacteroides segnis]|uniref:glycosyltransferase family 4 protein n=1 Tax=Parabacteroides segnis TaxID=2763058 RepID=UPI003511B51A